MTVKVGIPRALLYYQYHVLWITFFKELGAEIVLSDYSNKEILNRGTQSTVDEACIPIKLFHGHVESIKARVDILFIPRITSVHRDEYICPKFCGLPEMIKNSISHLPPLISPDINLFTSNKSYDKVIYEIGNTFTKDKRIIQRAYKKAREKYKDHCLRMKENHEIKASHDLIRSGLRDRKKRIMLLGHPYHLYDSFLNRNIACLLLRSGFEVITPEMFNRKDTDPYMDLYPARFFWTFANKLLGTAAYCVEKRNIDGFIYISTFGCGVDSVVADLAEKEICEKRKIPFLLLTLDEHGGEAGFHTRVEAFMDMLEWRMRDEDNISSYGQYLYRSESHV
ncbi:MAG: acyl-CoA dehydratase activase-related protein [Thermotaleaceae bacterium]